MAFPVSPADGQITEIYGVTYQFVSADSAWIRIPSFGNLAVGNINANNITATANITAGNIYTTNGLFWAGNGVAFSSGGGGGASALNDLTDVIISTPSNNQILKYNGSAWINDTNSGGGGGGITYTSDTVPHVSPNIADQWYDTTTDALFEYIEDGTTSYWVDIQSPTTFSAVPTTLQGTISINGAFSVTSSANIAGNISTSSNIIAAKDIISSNIITGNIIANGDITSIANVVSGNAVTGNITATGDITTIGNIVSANVTTSNVFVTGDITSTGFITSANIVTANVYSTGDITADGIITSIGIITTIANVISSNIETGIITATGDITTSGNVTASITVTSANVVTANVLSTGTITAVGKVISANVVTANVYADRFFYSNGTAFTSSNYGNAEVRANLTANPISTYSNTNVAAYLTGGNTVVGTSYWTIPVGTTAERPASAPYGATRFNSESGWLEVYANGAWGNAGVNLGIGATSLSAASSAIAIKNITGTTTDGFYWINFPSVGPTQIYCDMNTNGGGWMLAAKVYNNNSNFNGYSSADWTSTSTFNETQGVTYGGHIKTAAFVYHQQTAVRLCFGTTSANLYETGWSAYGSLKDIFSSGTARSSSNSRAAWIAWLNAGGISYTFGSQPNCNSAGANQNYTYSARLGISMNNEADCSSNDSSFGFGMTGTSPGSYGCGASDWNSGSSLNSGYQIGYIWVK